MMPKYIVLANFTEQRMRNIREHTASRRESAERLRALGITSEYYLTMGPYDAVWVWDAPDDETVARAILYIGSRGNVRTLTMKAFTEEEADRIIGGLPPA